MASPAAKVLIAVDESEHSERAVKYYLEYIHKPGYEVLLIHAAEPPTFAVASAMVGSGIPIAFDQYFDEEKTKAEVLEDKFAEIFKKNDVKFRFQGMFSYKPGEAIIEAAGTEKATLIITGTRGLGTVRRTLMGSVSDFVVHHATCPVLVCRG